MARTPVEALPEGYSLDYYVPVGEEGFAEGDRVVWVNSLDWQDDWLVGTVIEIVDRTFPNLREVHTSARVRWDNDVTAGEHVSTEALTTRNGQPLEIMDVEVFTNLYDVELH